MHRMILHTTAGVLMLSGLAACTVGPDYQAPDLTAQQAAPWSADLPQGTETDLTQWWELLEDSELTELIQQGLQSNLSLAETRERIVTARARRGVRNAERLPTLDASGAYERSQTGDEGLVLGGAPAGVEVDVYTLGVVAGWEVDLWGRVARLIEAADAEIEFSIEDARAARVALAAEIARELFTARALARELAIVDASLQADADSLAIARARAEAGLADELNAARASRVLEANRATIAALQAERREAELRLAVLLGRQPGTIQLHDQALPSMSPLPALGVPADLLRRRPDLRRAEREFAAATARIGAAIGERFPRVSIAGSIAMQGPDLSDTVNPNAYILQAGPSISIPLFAGGRIESNILIAESEQRQSLLRLQQSVLQAIAEVESAATRQAWVGRRLQQLQRAEAAALSTETLALDRYEAGLADFLNVTEARSARLSIERSRVTAHRDQLLALIDLYTALGGGWTDPDSQGSAPADQAAAATPTGSPRRLPG